MLGYVHVQGNTLCWWRSHAACRHNCPQSCQQPVQQQQGQMRQNRKQLVERRLVVQHKKQQSPMHQLTHNSQFGVLLAASL